jgi:hypothetical protein
MPDSARANCTQFKNWIRINVLLCVSLMTLTGCFGPRTMRYDIQQYNKDVLESEKEMLLYNIASLHYDEPPHFMMLSSIAQTRSFSVGAAFQWTNLWNNLLVPLMFTSPTVHGGNSYQSGLTTSAVENPTFSFVPIQGPDLAQRLESPVTDKLSFFLEDLNFSAQPNWLNQAQAEWLILGFGQSLIIKHKDTTKNGCHKAIYRNDPDDYDDFLRCTKEIIEIDNPNLVEIDANHVIPTSKPKDSPSSTEIVGALQANYKWAKIDEKYVLTNPVRISAWLDYIPNLKARKTSC